MPSTLTRIACQHLAQVFAHDIPLTSAMAVEVREWHNQRLQLHIPLTENRNHQDSMFGGSLYCAGVLACWGWLHLRLQEAGITNGEVVVQAGDIRYPAPANSDIQIRCQGPSNEAWDKFVHTYQRRQRARLSLTSQVFTADGQLAAELNGQYVLVATP